MIASCKLILDTLNAVPLNILLLPRDRIDFFFPGILVILITFNQSPD